MKTVLCFAVCFSLLFITGCWDRKELNDRAIWLATGWDLAENGGVEISGQIIIPSNVQTQGGGVGVGGTGKGFFTISATGKNVQDALEKMQAKLPREAFIGQRRIIFIGEEFAKNGLKKRFDSNSRNPDASLRTDMFVIKGGKAKDIIKIANPLEKTPAFATLKEHRQSGGRGDTAYLKFLVAANREGIRPSVPSIKISDSLEGEAGKGDSPDPKVLRIAGVSLFDKNLKLIGFLNDEGNKNMLWVMGILKKNSISIQKNGGTSSLNLTKIRSIIEPNFGKNKKLSFTVTLVGEGALTESNSGLNMENTNNLKFLEKEFEKEVQKHIQQTITKVQKEYGIDIFGFGEVIHRKNPIRWKALKTNWDQTFSETNITVRAKIKIKRIGMEGPPLLFKESEIKK
jgi:spore germination protein KC